MSERTPSPRKPAASRGFSLVELLVTVLILAIGLLGLAGLQARGLRDNKGALMRSQAVQCAQDILDRMRANRAAALAGSYNLDLGDDPPGSGVPFDDLTQWKTNLAALLPYGDGSITVDSSSVTVVIDWVEAARAGTGESTGEVQSITIVSRL